MSFILVPTGSGSPIDSLSLPYAVSLVCQDDGGGGNILINGLGYSNPSPADAVDLRTFFGATAFKSIPLLNAFRRIATSTATAAQQQLARALRVSIYALSAAAAAVPGVDYVGSAVANVPFLQLKGPSVAGFFRVEIGLRHSITN